MEFTFQNQETDKDKTFEQIFHLLYQRLCSFANQYLNNKDASEDVVSDVMHKLWRSKKSFNSLDDVKAYLYVSVRNNSISYLRKQKVVKNYVEDFKQISSDKFYKDHLVEEELTGIMNQALAQLPEKARKVFELTCIEGNKYKAVAEELNLSVNTVKSQRARAIRMLKELLKDSMAWMALLSLLS